MSSNSGSSSNSDSDADIAVGREVAYRLFAAEYDDATLSHTESDEERAPNYVVTPTGARINRLFVVGALTEISPVNEEMLRARVVDPTGAFVVYAGQYQPEALAFLERAEPPMFVAVTGKARTFQPEDSDQVYTSVRPESIATVDADTRDRWVVTTAEQTRERIGAYATAAGLGATGDALTDALLESDLEAGLATGIPLVQAHYGTTPTYLEALNTLALEAVGVVAGERDEVGPFDRSPEYSDSNGDFETLTDATEFEIDADVAGSSAVTSAAASEAELEAESDGAIDESGEDTIGESGEVSDEPEDGITAESDDGVTAESDEGSEDELDAVESEPQTGVDSDERSEAETTASFDESTDVAEIETDTDADAETDTDADTDGDATTADDSPAEQGTVDADDLGTGMYEMDDEERAELEAEFGAEFTTGSDVDDPGDADIETPDSEAVDAEASEEQAESVETTADEPEPETDLEESELEAESEEDTDSAESGSLGDFQPESDGLEDSSTEEPDTEPDADTDDQPDTATEDVDLESAAVDTMRDLDDGDGAERGAVVKRVVEDTGADEADVQDAIDDALMGGQCYEPDDETLKPI